MDEAICKRCCQQVSLKSANATNLKHLQGHHPQQYAELFLDVQKVISHCSYSLSTIVQ